MSKTLIFGGSGKVARHLTRILSKEEGHTVHSIIRNAAQIPELEPLGAKPIVQSIEDASVSDLVETIKKVNPDTVVWAAGAGGGNPERTVSVDNKGAIKSMDATAQAGVKRYIIVSAVDVRDRENKPVPDWYDAESKERSDKVWNVIGVYMKAKFAADKELRTGNDKRKLDYTIIRPGGLSLDPSVGKVAAGKVSLERTISREDVARVIVESIKNKGTIGLAFDIVGGETPIADAVGNVTKNKIDTFEGYY